MAEVVSVLIDKVKDLLVEKTIETIVFLNHVPGKVEDMKTLLVDMHTFLKYADETQDEDPRIREWVSKIRSVAYDAEDVLDTFIVEIVSMKEKKMGFLQMLFLSPQKLWCLYNVGKDIESIQEKMSKIHESREAFGVKNLGEGQRRRFEELRELRLTTPFKEDKDLVGLEDKTSSVLELLLGEDRCRRVISIVGMAGVGKTTLARAVYNHSQVGAKFEYRAWVYISQKYNPREVLGDIILQVEEPTFELIQMLKDMQEGLLVQRLRRKLQEKRYLVVLDDIWEQKAWDRLEQAFPDSNKGSRLLLTSRHESVSRHADPSSNPYAMETLEENDSWELFLKRAFPGSRNPRCPRDLEDIGREIVDSCGGLPLAISVIGSVLQERRKLVPEWRNVLKTLSACWSGGGERVSAILELSYNDLPLHLKPCFSYFGFFPEGYEIPTRRLFHLWIAEGFIHQKGSENLKDVAADYLDRLIERNLVQVVALRADERVKSCKVHDLLRELAIRRAEEELFLRIQGSKVQETLALDKSRRLAVQGSFEGTSFTARSTPELRSLVFFMPIENAYEIKSFTRLRVLDLENTTLICLSEEIGELALLRYLGLRNTRIRRLPKSLGNLRCLQTLDIWNDYNTGVQVPDVIWKLQNLKHLYMWGVSCCNGAPKLESLSNLRTLSYVHIDHLIHNLSMLSNIRKLGVKVETNSNMDRLCNSIAKLENLESLRIWSGYDELPSLVGTSIPDHVNNLKLQGMLRALPSHHQFPQNLSRLTLAYTGLKEDPLPILEKLEALSVLKLVHAYYGSKMSVSRKGFLQLKFLQLVGLDQLIGIDVGRGAMPELSCLRILRAPRLELLPEELQNMRSLRKVEARMVSYGFIARLKGEDSFKVSHVPIVMLQVDLDPLREKIRISFAAYRAALRFIEAEDALNAGEQV